MSKTYRNVREDELEDVNEKKIKNIDKKHYKAKVTDGAYHKGIEDDEGGYLYVTNEQKKTFKKHSKKQQRNSKMPFEDFYEE